MQYGPWFRMYAEVVDDPKVQMLPLLLFRAWVNCMCLTKLYGGALPDMREVAYRLHVTQARAEIIVGQLIEKELFEKENDVIRPHEWDNRQFKSDGSTERVRQFRKRSGNVERNGDETFPIQKEKVSPTPPSKRKTDSENRVQKHAPEDTRRVPFIEFVFKTKPELVPHASCFKALKQLLKATQGKDLFSVDFLQEYWLRFITSPNKFHQEQGRPLQFFCLNINAFVGTYGSENQSNFKDANLRAAKDFVNRELAKTVCSDLPDVRQDSE